MIAGVRGRLITVAFAEAELPAIAGNAIPPRDIARAFDRWSAHRETVFGPASSVRAIAASISLRIGRICAGRSR